VTRFEVLKYYPEIKAKGLQFKSSEPVKFLKELVYLQSAHFEAGCFFRNRQSLS